MVGLFLVVYFKLIRPGELRRAAELAKAGAARIAELRGRAEASFTKWQIRPHRDDSLRISAVMGNDELVDVTLAGHTGANRVQANGILVLTSRRLLFAAKPSTSLEWLVGRIEGISVQHGTVMFVSSGRDIRFWQVHNADKLAMNMRAAMNAATAPVSQAAIAHDGLICDYCGTVIQRAGRPVPSAEPSARRPPRLRVNQACSEPRSRVCIRSPQTATGGDLRRTPKRRRRRARRALRHVLFEYRCATAGIEPTNAFRALADRCAAQGAAGIITV